MERFSDYKQALLNINNELTGLLSLGTSIPGVATDTLSAWMRSCQRLHRQLAEETLRIAVVGTIKSGKSTFLNSLLGGDYLKRGAGVVTSIVTRIHRGPHPVCRLVFKSWPEVNQEIAQALTLVPTVSTIADKGSFDMRDTSYRESLKKLIDSLPVEQLVSHGARNLNTILLTSYLSGYARVKDILTEQNVLKHFEKDGFIDHWQYVGNDSLAIYLKDLQLELNSNYLDSDTELADCQGSDSPNPLHMTMIQDYLQQAHLVTYVVSSRTGVREADIKFLSIIRKMGLAETVVLVVNADISEHESLSDLRRLTERVSTELDLIIPDPQCFTLSALYHLFETLRDRLSEKDRMRLAQWEHQTDLSDFSKTEYARFQKHLRQRLFQKRYQLMLKSQIERHSIILDGMSDWINMVRELLSRGDDDTRSLIDSIAAQKERMQQIRMGVESTTAGVVPKIKSELNVDVNRFFDTHSGASIRQLFGFIRDYQVDFNKYQRNLETSGFSNTLYMVFQEFKQAIDITMNHTIYPSIVNFVKSEEQKIAKHLKAIIEPYESIVEQGLVELKKVLHDFEAEGHPKTLPPAFEPPDIEAVKVTTGLRLPPLVSFLQYSNRIKAEAFVHAGYFSVLKIFKKVYKNSDSVRSNAYVKALQRSVRRMKQQTEESLLFECKNYRENLKFAYLHRLVEEVTQRITEDLTDRFRIFGDGTAVVTSHARRLQPDKEQAAATLRKMEILVTATGEKMRHLRLQIERSEA
jgi:GTP-binding protein EngB required for normal cell division